MEEWSLTFEDVSTVYARLKVGGMYHLGSDDPTPGRLLYLAAVGMAVRRSGKRLLMQRLFRYGAEWFGIPESVLWDSTNAAIHAAGYTDIRTWWEWVTKPARVEKRR